MLICFTSPWQGRTGEVTFGNEIKTLYLNVTKAITDTLKEIGMKDLLKEETRLADCLKM